MVALKYIVYNLGILITYGLIAFLSIRAGKKSSKKHFKYFFYNFSAIFIALFLFEVYHYTFDENSDRNVKFTGTFADNPLASGPKKFVGYGPKEDTSFTLTSIRKNDNILIFDVNYSFNEGRRIVLNNTTAEHQLVFLGCSHVFGDGLNDNQTLPYFINKLTQNKYDVKNYGFSGYGTHQALAITENLLAKTKNNHIIYVFIPDHIERAAGYKSWNVRGPRYEIEDGDLVLKGPFKKKESYFGKRFKTIWRNSYTYKRLFTPTANKKDYLRVKEMVYKMNELAKTNSNTFSVVVAGFDFDYKKNYINDLKAEEIPVLVVSEKINTTKKEKYFIKGDGHPNEQYNEELAKSIIKELLQ